MTPIQKIAGALELVEVALDEIESKAVELARDLEALSSTGQKLRSRLSALEDAIRSAEAEGSLK